MTQVEPLAALIERLRELLAKATPGPWEAKQDGIIDFMNVSYFIEAGKRLVSHGHMSEADRDVIVEAVNALPGLLTTLEHLSLQLSERTAALTKIAEGDEPRPVGKHWFPDGRPSKHDQCTHGVWMYEACGNCIAEFARKSLGERA